MSNIEATIDDRPPTNQARIKFIKSQFDELSPYIKKKYKKDAQMTKLIVMGLAHQDALKCVNQGYLLAKSDSTNPDETPLLKIVKPNDLVS